MIGLLKEQALTTAVLNGVGAALKHTPLIANWMIPYALMLGGAAIQCGLNGGVSTVSILWGMFSGLAAVGAHQGVRGITERTSSDPSKSHE